MSDALPKIGNVLHPVGEVAAASQFYGECLGLGVKSTHGDRFSALDGGSTTLALAGPAEDITGGVVAASFKVADLNATVEAVIARGGEVVRPAEPGAHEVRAVVRDPWRNTFVLYSSLR